MVKISFTVFFAISIAICSNSPTEALRDVRKFPEEVLHLIFNNLELLDLIHVTEADDAFLEPAIWSFRHLQAYKTVTIMGRRFSFSGKNEEDFIRKGEGIILINAYEAATKVLNNFGNAIEKLDLDYQSMSPTEMAEIQRIIRENCANTLKHFGVTTKQPNYTDLIPTVFPNVESVSIMWTQLDIDVDLNEKFPKMRTLDLNNVLSENGKLIDHHFPHLEEINFQNFDMEKLNETHIERVLQKNPQIKSVITETPTKKILRLLHEHLPNMESLSVKDETKSIFDQNNPVIHFDNMKKFTLHMENRFYRDPEQFPFTFGDKLEEFKLVWCCDLFSPKWIEFFERFSNVPYYSVEFPGRCREEFWPDLTELNMPNVQELRLTYIDLGVFRKIWNKIKHQQQLEIVHVIGLEQGEHGAIRDEINADWKMNVFRNQKWDDKIDVVLSKM